MRAAGDCPSTSFCPVSSAKISWRCVNENVRFSRWQYCSARSAWNFSLDDEIATRTLDNESRYERCRVIWAPLWPCSPTMASPTRDFTVDETFSRGSVFQCGPRPRPMADLKISRFEHPSLYWSKAAENSPLGESRWGFAVLGLHAACLYEDV